jgi:hypothetical protein
MARLSRGASRRGLRRSCTGLAVAALVVSAAGCSTSSTVAVVGASSTASSVSPPVASTEAPSRYIFGQITAQNGAIWTVQGIHGNTYTATLTALTLYGTVFHRRTRDEFKVGDTVRVAGNITGTTIAPATAVDLWKRSVPKR